MPIYVVEARAPQSQDWLPAFDTYPSGLGVPFAYRSHGRAMNAMLNVFRPCAPLRRFRVVRYDRPAAVPYDDLHPHDDDHPAEVFKAQPGG
jgi:hypothetical protein